MPVSIIYILFCFCLFIYFFLLWFVQLLPLLLIRFSMVLSTNDHGKFLQEIVSKCAAQFSIIPLVPNISSLKIANDCSQPREIDEHGIL